MLLAPEKKSQVEIEAVFLTARWPIDGSPFFFGDANLIDRGDERSARRISIVGQAEQEELKPQLTYRLLGRWKEHPKYGKQFAVETFHLSRPYGRLGVVRYLQEAPGIGPTAAEHLWQAFQGDAVRVLRETPEQCAAVLKRVPVEKLREASEFLKGLQAMEGISIELTDLLHGYGFPVRVANAAVRIWGNRAYDIIKRDPYKLQRFRGCGFLRCDKLYLALGLPPTRLRRQTLCGQYSLASDRAGHVWFPIEVMASAVKAHFGSIASDCEAKASGEPAGVGETARDSRRRVRGVEPLRALELGIRARRFVTRRDCRACWGAGARMQPDLFSGTTMEMGPCPDCHGTGGKQWVAEAVKAQAEGELAQFVAAKIGISRLWPSINDIAKHAPTITEHQKAELAKALASPLAMLGGAPGTGKTFVSAAVVKAIIAIHGADAVAVCAPTGKAAVRCTETLHRYHVDSVRATTIHSLLGVETRTGSGDGDSEGGWSFRHSSRSPLPYRFVIVDESSMIPVSLMRSLLSACHGGTNVLLVGDVNQLPPVEYGAPLRDFRKVLPYGELTEIHRNAGTIVRACAAIRDQQPIPLDSAIEISEGLPPKNLVLHGATRDEAPHRILRLVGEVAKARSHDPIWGVQVVVATNKSGPLSRRDLNKRLQDMLNPNGAGNAQSPFRVGDKVICVKNSTLPLADRDLHAGDDDQWRRAGNKMEALICNGEFGRVLQVSPTQTVVRFQPDRVVMISRKAGAGGKGGSGDRENATGDDGDSPADEKTDTGCDLDLGYAVTCHKMQGSSAPAVIVALDEGQAGDHGVCDRSWIFTAISRAETECHLVGKRDTLKKMSAKTFIERRRTMLDATIERLVERAAAGATAESGGVGSNDAQRDEATPTPPPAEATIVESKQEPPQEPKQEPPPAKRRFSPPQPSTYRRQGPTADQALELIDEIEELAEQVPSAGEDFAESVLEKAKSIGESIERKKWVTEKQYAALENFRAGLLRWVENDRS